MGLSLAKWRLCKKTPLGRWTPISQEEIDDDGPQLLMIDDDMTGEMNRGAVAGRIEWTDDIDDTTRYMHLRGDKLIRVNMYGVKVPLWAHYKRETYSYPSMPKQDSEHTAKTMIGIQQDYKNLEEARKLRQADLWKKYLIMAGIGIGIIAAIYIGLPWIVQLLDINVNIPWV